MGPKDLFYINSDLDNGDLDIFYFYNNDDQFQVVLKSRKGYEFKIKFKNEANATEFLNRIGLKHGSKIGDYIKVENETIIIPKDVDNTYFILCGENEMLAQKLVKMLRKQQVVQDKKLRKNKVEPEKIKTRKEIEQIGIKF